MGMIVVGVDGSDTALTAALRSAEIARALGDSLHVVSAVTSDKKSNVRTDGTRWTITSLDAAENTLADVVTRLPTDLDKTTAAVTAKPAEALIQEAERVGATLIIVGNKNMHGIGRVLGSVANDVAHHAPCDVLIVKTT
jgi:nucleotide-binding universal stress UspA family protein